MFAPIKSRSSPKLGQLGRKIGYQVKSKETLNTLEVTVLTKSRQNSVQYKAVSKLGYLGLNITSPGHIKGISN